MKIHSILKWTFETTLGRIIVGVFAAFVFVLAVIVGSVWTEYRFPSDDAARALLPEAQRVVTKPIVNAIGRQAERYVRRQAERPLMQPGMSSHQIVALFLDENVPLKSRRAYAYRLARDGSPECVSALLKVFQSASPDDLAYMATLIGKAGNPAAKAWLWPLLENANEVVVIGAMRGLSTLGGEEVTILLAGILADNRLSERLRVEAASGLGTLGTPAAREALLAMLERTPSNELSTHILSSLAQYPFSEIAGAFERHLNTDLPVGMRVTAIESLTYSSSDATSFLLNLAGHDADADVRAAAAWAISTHHTVKDLGPALATLAEREPEADVRRRLYEAMLPQREIPTERVLPVVLAENDIAARVAGFNALGTAARRGGVAGFDEHVVPELQRIATSPNSLNIQMRAVFALRRAQTPAALNALAIIAGQARPQVAAAARNGLPKGS